jgi:hypothetical protein
VRKWPRKTYQSHFRHGLLGHLTHSKRWWVSPKARLRNLRSEIPPEWIVGDEAALDALLERLMLRCKRVPDLIADSVNGRVSPFPCWVGTN